MMALTSLDLLEKEIRRALDQQIEVVAGGSPEDYAHYREHVGVILGLRIALQEVQRRQKQEHQDDE